VWPLVHTGVPPSPLILLFFFLPVPDMDMDPERFRLPGGYVAHTPPPPKRLPRHRPGEQFLKGPIPCSWLNAAARCSGKAFQVAMALWQVAGIRSDPRVRLPQKHLREMGVSPGSARRGLVALEAAGLVAVERSRHSSPWVTLLDAPGFQNSSEEGQISLTVQQVRGNTPPGIGVEPLLGQNGDRGDAER